MKLVCIRPHSDPYDVDPGAYISASFLSDFIKEWEADALDLTDLVGVAARPQAVRMQLQDCQGAILVFFGHGARDAWYWSPSDLLVHIDDFDKVVDSRIYTYACATAAERGQDW